MRSRAILLLATLSSGACSRHGNTAADSGATATGTNAPASPAYVNPTRRAAADATTTHISFAPNAPAPDASRPPAPARTATAGEVLRVAGGSYHLGSTPGDLGRDPGVEADGIAIDVPSFDIDALPYPNDPSQASRTGATRDEAANLCRQRNRRLCTEIEWERACRGPAENIFPGSDGWNAARCAGRGDPGACASGYGALVMGTRSAEWTADNLDERAVIRGAGGTAAAAIHRCASRRTAVANTPGLDVAFRCCGGSPPQIAYPREQPRTSFREEPMGAAQISQIVATIPELSRVREGFAIFSPAAAAEVLHHGATTAEQHPEVHLTVSPVRWSPTFGEDLLVITATSTVGSFVAALWVLPPLEGRTPRYRHAASFILAGDRISMALAYGPSTREEIQWSACWNCGGEHGVIHYSREDARAIAVQR